jgi:cytochrome c
MSETNRKTSPAFLSTFTVLIMLLTFAVLVALVVQCRHSIPTVEDTKREQRLKTLSDLNAENGKILTQHRWIDKDKGVVGIPIIRAMDLVLADLLANAPHAPGPIAIQSTAGNQLSPQAQPINQPQNPSTHVDQSAVPTGDAKAGKVIFLQCAACHSLDPDTNKIGPTLAGIFGRKAGSIEDFNYSDANKNSGIVWDENVLRKYLADPQKVVPGTKMAFPGLKDPKQIEDVIAYLKEATEK